MGLFDKIKEIGKVGASFIPGGSTAFDLADAGLSAIGAFKGAGDADRAARQSFADKMGDLRSQHAQNWFGADDYDYQNKIQRSPRQNWLRALMGGSGVEGAENRLSSGLVDLFAPQWQGRNYDDLMKKTDPSQFYEAPKKRGFFSKLGDAVGAGIGAGISGAREQNRFNQQMDAMRDAYGTDRWGAAAAGRADAQKEIEAAKGPQVAQLPAAVNYDPEKLARQSRMV